MPIKDLEQSSWLNGPNASYIESFYESWLKDPASVSEQWRNYFAQMLMEDAGDISREALHSEIVTSLANRPHAGVVCDVSRQDLEIAGKQVFVQQLIAAYRVLGTRRAQLDPLKRHGNAPLSRGFQHAGVELGDIVRAAGEQPHHLAAGVQNRMKRAFQQVDPHICDLHRSLDGQHVAEIGHRRN